MDYRPVPTGAAQKSPPHDVTVSWLHLQFTERFRPLAEAGKCAHRPVRSTRRVPHRIGSPTYFMVRLGMHAVGLARNFSRHAVFVPLPSGHARLTFLVKEIFSLQLKIKLIFFLSVSQLISTLKPAGEGGNRAHVNKL